MTRCDAMQSYVDGPHWNGKRIQFELCTIEMPAQKSIRVPWHQMNENCLIAFAYVQLLTCMAAVHVVVRCVPYRISLVRLSFCL